MINDTKYDSTQILQFSCGNGYEITVLITLYNFVRKRISKAINV